MIKVSPVNEKTKDGFINLFCDYYAELGCEDDAKHLAEEYVIPDLLAGLLSIDVLEEDGKLAGFAIYQTDAGDGEWCLMEGWGDIREIYVVPQSRGQGFGKFLLYTAEMKLRESGTLKAYCLPYESAIDFFTACGYTPTDDYNEELDCFVFKKTKLDNACK